MQTRRLMSPAIPLAGEARRPAPDRTRRRARALGRFWRCRSGGSALEFALTIPIFVLMLAGVAEISMVTFVSVLAEGGLREAARYGITGQTPDSSTRAERIVEIVQEHTHNLITVDSSNVTFKVYQDYAHIGSEEPYTDDNGNGSWDDGESFTDWNGNGTWDSDTGESGSGGSGDIVLYEITYQWDFMTPIFKVFGGDDGKLDLTASIAVRNEPWDSAGDDT